MDLQSYLNDADTIEREGLDVHISRTDDDLNVIGMNFLSSLSAWSVQGRNLRLKS